MTRTIRFTLPIAGLTMDAQLDALRVAIYKRLPAGWHVDDLSKNFTPDYNSVEVVLHVSPMAMSHEWQNGSEA